MGFRSIVRTIAGRVFGFDKNSNPVWNRNDESQLAIDTDDSEIPYVEVTTRAGTTRYTVGGGAGGGVTATVLLDIVRVLNDPVSGATLAIDETLCWDINYWLTADQIADARDPGGPSLNLTAAIQYAHDQLIAKFASAPTNKNGAFCGLLHFHNAYIVDGFDNWNQAIGIKGDNMRDCFFLQSATPRPAMFNVVAPQGRGADSKAPYWFAEDFAVFGDATALSGGTVLCSGIVLPSGAHTGDAYGGCFMQRVQVWGFSGNCFYIAFNRHAPKLRFCHFSAGGGVSLLGDGSDYVSNVYIGARSDGEMLHCGCGGGHGHSVEIANCDTMQVKGGDYWSSAHAELGYNAFQISDLDYIILEGMDCNGRLSYVGNQPKSSQVRLVSINFRFRGASFGDTDPNQDGTQPAPLDSYIYFKASVNTVSEGCTFTPWYSKVDGTAQARPRWIYSLDGSNTRHVARDHLPDIASNDWPSGAAADGTLITPTYTNSICDSDAHLSMDLSVISESDGFHGPLFKYARFMPGEGSGLVGRLDGRGAATGTVGEQFFSKVTGAGAVDVPAGTKTNVTNFPSSAPLPPGDWWVYAPVQWKSSTATTGSFIPSKVVASISTLSGADISAGDATMYASHAFGSTTLSVAGLDFDCIRLGPTRMNVSSTEVTTSGASGRQLWLNVQCAFTGTTTALAASAYGELRAVRTV